MAFLVHQALALTALLSLGRVLHILDKINSAKKQAMDKNLRWWTQLRAPSSKTFATRLENLGDRLGKLGVEHVGDALCQNL